MNADSAHKSGWEIAEVVFGVPFLVGVVLHFLVPLAVPEALPRLVLIPIGLVLVGIAIGLVVLARREFARYGQHTDPGHPTSKVIKTGVFSISRNPLYLATILLVLGISLTLNMLWTLITLPVSILLCLYVLVLPEESYLTSKFGDEYTDYMATVRRWIGRK